MAKLEKFEIVPFGPYRFIGKTVYAPPGSGEIFGKLWGDSKETFDAINAMTEYATEEVHDVAFMTWSVEKSQLGYSVGKFMKPDAPTPDGLDAFDIPFSYMAKGWASGEFDDMIQNAPTLTEEAINAQTDYVFAWSEEFVGAEVYSKDTIPKEGVSSILGYYIPCVKKA